MVPDLLNEPASPAAPDARGEVADLPTSKLAAPGNAPAGGDDWSARFGSDVATNVARAEAGAVPPPEPFPVPGQLFAGFELLSELGRGAMGRVFLAQQQSPVSRVVVLKVGHHLSSECQKLAKLQHPNVVPVYSFHEQGRSQAVCMPYRGPLTLAHVVARIRSADLHTFDGLTLTTVIEECRKVRQPAVEVLESAGPARPAAPHTPAPAPVLFPELRGLTHVDAVLTITRQVVDGLRVAHAARIVHSDLKPANVLIADDGCAQLIDFGVAYDKSDVTATRLRLGGTRPYMAPEQLRSLATSTLEHDERCDLYAVGVILYELLTGRVPYPPDIDPSAEALDRDRRSRFAPPDPLRELNPRVPHAVAAIIDKCLAPDLADRYQAAAHLLDDIDRQLARRPLRYAANTCRTELATKWATRNRAALAAVAVLLACGATAYGVVRRDASRAEEAQRLALIAAGEGFETDLEEAEFQFGMADGDPAHRDRARAAARRALDRFGAWDDDAWFRRGAFQGLPPDRLDGYRRRSAGLMLLLANSHAQEGTRGADAAAREGALRAALEWNARAEATHPAADGCRAVWAQRAFLTRLAGDPAGAERFARRAEAIRREAPDAVLEGRQFLIEGRNQAARKALAEAVKADPKSFWANFYAAAANQAVDEFRDALTGYTVCEALRPGFYGTAFNRGVTRYRLAQFPEAEADFDRALEARPEWAAAHFHRGLTREAQRRYGDAIEDLNRALEYGYAPTSVYLVRSRVHGRLGDKKAAEADFAEGVKAEPADEGAWLARAQARLYRDPAAALTDYEQALKINPRLAPALQGKAHLLNAAGKDADALAVLTALLEVNPDSADAWAGRGVTRARLGDRAGALADAREALRLTERPATQYQVAGIYALTSRAHPEDRREALSLLDAALRAGFGFEHLDADRELDPVRGDKEFKRLVDAARKYRNSLKKID